MCANRLVQIVTEKCLCKKMVASLGSNNVFFSNLVNAIPSEYYFKTDEEQNWLKSNPQAVKYHKNVQIKAPKQVVKENTKKAKRVLKFNPKEQITNTERLVVEAKKENKDMDGLRARLMTKITNCRKKRKAEEQKSKGRGLKRKKMVHVKEEVKKVKSEEKIEEQINYGSLLMKSKKEEKPKKKEDMKMLLKKAEEKKLRMEELKQTAEGKAELQSKGLAQVLHQEATGETIKDDTKLLKKALKKKEKLKMKSAKAWKQRVATQTKETLERRQKKIANIRGKRVKGQNNPKKSVVKDAKTERKGKGRFNPSAPAAAPRAGFEGKKGEKSFINNKKE